MKKKATTTKPCPRCGKATTPHDRDMWWCEACRALWDNDPDEGGDYSSDPSRRLERQEEQRAKRPRGRR